MVVYISVVMRPLAGCCKRCLQCFSCCVANNSFAYDNYSFQRLKQLTKRQVDLNFEALVQRYQAKQKEQEEIAFKSK